MREYIDFNKRLREIYQEAEQETIRLILESGLTEVILSDECDIAYAHHDNGCGLNEDAVTIVKVGEMDNGDKYLMFKCEGKDEETDCWEFCYEVQESITIDIYEAVHQTLTL